MAKAELELVKMVLHRNELDIRTVSRIMEDLQREVQNQQEDGEKSPRVKKAYAVVVSDSDGSLTGKDLAGWVLQLPEDDAPSEAIHRLIQAAHDYNVSPKGRKAPVRTIAEACENIPPRITKEHSIWIKTKDPIQFVAASNAIVSETSSKLKQADRL